MDKPSQFDGSENDPLIKSGALKNLDEIEHNPPAFPQQEFARVGEVSQGAISGGMSLRDYFAASSLRTGVLVQDILKRPKEMSQAEFVAKSCYEMADAMLNARKVKSNG